MISIRQIKHLLVEYALRPLFERLGYARFSRFGLHSLDDKLAPYLSFQSGVFVELGANDGRNQSNTYYLEKFKGWTGVLIEPLPRLYQQAVRHRPHSQVFNYACVSADYVGDFIEITDLSLMSFVDGALKSNTEIQSQISNGLVMTDGLASLIRVPTRTLTQILEEAKVQHIDFLSLDVEGYEASVLRGLDFDKFRPVFILVEARYQTDIEQIIGPYYDFVDKLTVHDILYRARD